MDHFVNIEENEKLKCSVAHFNNANFALDSGYKFNNPPTPI